MTPETAGQPSLAKGPAGNLLTADALAAFLARGVPLDDADDRGAAVDLALRQRVLAQYREALAGVDPAAVQDWLLTRLALLEARVLALQLGQLKPGGGPAAELPVAPPPAPPAPPPAPPKVPEEDPILATFLGNPPAPPADTRPRTAQFTWDSGFMASGFYPQERSAEAGLFCWIGPDPRASVHLPQVRLPAMLRAELPKIYNWDILSRITVSVNGGAALPATVTQSGQFHVLEVMVPAEFQTDAPSMRLDFDTVETKCPRDAGYNDSRRLSVAVSRVEAVSTSAE